LRFLNILLFVILMSAAAFGQESSTKTSGIGTREADDSVRVIGNLPYTNQWTFERPSNYLYISYEQLPMASQAVHVSHFETDYSTHNIGIIALDYFSKITPFADALGTSPLRRFGLWGRYKIGFGTQSGTVVDDSTNSILIGEKSSLIILEGELELQVAYDWLDWIQPYVGFNFIPYYFRNTSSTTGAESEGQGSLYGPAIGVHLPLFFSHKGSIFGELHQSMATASSNQVFGTHLGGDVGVGLVF
jgi:hypothetical protein